MGVAARSTPAATLLMAPAHVAAHRIPPDKCPTYGNFLQQRSKELQQKPLGWLKAKCQSYCRRSRGCREKLIRRALSAEIKRRKEYGLPE